MHSSSSLCPAAPVCMATAGLHFISQQRLPTHSKLASNQWLFNPLRCPVCGTSLCLHPPLASNLVTLVNSVPFAR